MGIRYEQFLRTDFDKEADCIAILHNEKHTRLEGLFTEIRFQEEIMDNFFPEYSSGWWFLKVGSDYEVCKFTHDVATLTALDFELLNYFRDRNMEVVVAEFSESDSAFYMAGYEGEEGRFIDEWGAIKKEMLPRTSEVGIPDEENRIQTRLDKVTDFLKEHGSLKKFAIDRVFANCWLGSGPIWDIDFFVRYGDKIIAFEVKQKFPTASGMWGLNKGEADLFNYLNSSAVDLYYIILQKPDNDKKKSVIDLYKDEEMRKNSKWIGTKFYPSFLTGHLGVAPGYTSLDGKKKVGYYDLNQALFTVIRHGEGENNILYFLERFP